jgi:hypothetical protein
MNILLVLCFASGIIILTNSWVGIDDVLVKTEAPIHCSGVTSVVVLQSSSRETVGSTHRDTMLSEI